MNATPSAERPHIVLFGVRNAGKSSLVNAIAGREVSIVSPTAGTTTDPVNRAMELGDLGPVVLVDTAGVDDVGELGAMRVGRSLDRLESADVALLVTPLGRAPEPEEERALARALSTGRPAVIAATFARGERSPEKLALVEKARSGGFGRAIQAIEVDNSDGLGVEDLKRAIVRAGAEADSEPTPLEGLVHPGELVVLVVPIDSAAPKGRIILPQAETLRDALDRGCRSLVVRETELAEAYARLGERPAIVVTDSQAFAHVSSVLPQDQALTGFSVLFARKKGDLGAFARGIEALERMARERRGRPYRVLVLEACTHHRKDDDIGTVKLPRLFNARVPDGGEFRMARDLPGPEELSGYDLVVACGACMVTRSRMKALLARVGAAGVPVANYGMFLAWANGIAERALEPLGFKLDAGALARAGA
jgi:[FeFe] hydrogenase H-cluster maturation GTPase HydF